MNVNEEKLNPLVKDILALVLSVKDDVPKNMVVMMISYAMAEVASNLRAKMRFYNGETKPLNFYAYVFAPSGVGKDVSLNALNRIFIDSFGERMKKGFDKHKTKYWEGRHMELVDQDLEEDEIENLIKEEMRLVNPFSYRIASGTEAGISRSRVTYGYYEIGAINLVIDELGANYPKLRELLALMLSSYEDGDTNARMLKNESVMAVKGVPSNFLGYSSPALIFDGGATEKALLDDLSQGQARRSFFAVADKPEKEKLTAAEMVAKSRSKTDNNGDKIKEVNDYFAKLAHPKNMYRELSITEESEIAIATYQIKCDELAEGTRNIQEQERLELINRPYKAQRLAGIYAFISNSEKIELEFIEQAIYIAELSGISFTKVMNQPPIYERVFNFINGREKTSEIDLVKNQWYKGNQSQKRELLSLARAYGYENDHLFKLKEVEGVEFYSFVEVPKTDVNNITISISQDITKGFKKKKVPFEVLHEVVCSPDFNYSAGTFKKGYRNKENYEEKQNLIIIDIDDGMKLETAKMMFANYKCMMATTKSHQKDKNGLVCDRFRMIFITDRTIKLNSELYSDFMSNVYDSLGVPADQSCKDSSRFYYGAEGDHWYSEGDKLFEISDLIPETSKEKERKSMLVSSGIGSSSGLERVLLEEAIKGSRNNVVLKWATFLKDEGYDYDDVETKVFTFNDKLLEPLLKKELDSTVLKTLKRSYR